METIYGHFDDEQIERYKVQLHKELFWLLLYKDPKKKEECKNAYFDKYFDTVMKKMDGLNELLFYPTEIIGIMSLLRAAYKETKKIVFDFQEYRKLILKAHSLVDKINKDGDKNV